MAEQRYYVIGGEYADTSFTNPLPGTELETHGPFSERDAKIFWRSLTGKTVDNAMIRYVLKPEDQVVGKVYWVVGGEYADSSFTRFAKGKEIEVYGPFEHGEAAGFWRGLTAKSVDDALVRYDIRKNYHADDGSSPSMKLRAPTADVPRIPLARTITKSIAIAAPQNRVFSFLMDGKNWPQWAIRNVKSVKPLADGTWELETTEGSGNLKLIGDTGTGIIDQVVTSPNSGVWRVPGRVVPVTGGSVVTMVYSKPDSLSDKEFDEGMVVLDEELAALKKVWEAKV
jgi:hypothetical protein